MTRITLRYHSVANAYCGQLQRRLAADKGNDFQRDQQPLLISLAPLFIRGHGLPHVLARMSFMWCCHRIILAASMFPHRAGPHYSIFGDRLDRTYGAVIIVFMLPRFTLVSFWQLPWVETARVDGATKAKPSILLPCPWHCLTAIVALSP